MTITEFLEARIDEDEERASSGWSRLGDTRWETNNYGQDHLTPAAVLAECVAKRAIITLFGECHDQALTAKNLETEFALTGMEEGLGLAVRSLSTAYKDHADYQQDWALTSV